MCGNGGGTDQALSSSPFDFAAIAGVTVVVMLAWAPGHGTCPQGGHTKSAVPGIADVSVLLPPLDLPVSSELQ